MSPPLPYRALKQKLQRVKSMISLQQMSGWQRYNNQLLLYSHDYKPFQTKIDALVQYYELRQQLLDIPTPLLPQKKHIIDIIKARGLHSEAIQEANDYMMDILASTRLLESRYPDVSLPYLYKMNILLDDYLLHRLSATKLKEKMQEQKMKPLFKKLDHIRDNIDKREALIETTRQSDSKFVRDIPTLFDVFSPDFGDRYKSMMRLFQSDQEEEDV